MLVLGSWFFLPAAGAQDLLYNGYANETTTYDPGGSVTADYMFIGGKWEGSKRAAQFQAPTGGHHVVESIGLPIYHNGTLNLRISIVEDDGDAPGTTVLWSVVNPPQVTTVLAHREIPAVALLQPGETYWLVLEPESVVESAAYWQASSPPFAGREALSMHMSGQWGAWGAMQTPDRAAFQIHGRRLASSILIYNGYSGDEPVYDPSSSGSVGVDYDDMGERRAAKFQAPGGAVHVVDAVGLPIYHYPGQPLNLRISIVPDDNGIPGSSALWTVTNPPQVTSELAHRVIPATAVLQPGEDYWLVLEPAVLAGDEFIAYWHVSSPPFAGIAASEMHTSGSWEGWYVFGTSDRPAFQVYGRPVATAAEMDVHTAIEIRFDTVHGSYYFIETADTPADETWTTVGAPFMGMGGPTSVFHSTVGTPRGVYRVWTE